MNKNTFINAMTQIDDSYIDEIMEKRAMLLLKINKIPQKLFKRLIPLVACIAILVCAVPIVAYFLPSNSFNNYLSGVTPVTDDPSDSQNDCGVFEVYEDFLSSSKPIVVEGGLSSMRFTSYCDKNEPTTLTVGCGMDIDYMTKNNYMGYPLLKVYEISSNEKGPSINGNFTGYEAAFVGEDGKKVAVENINIDVLPYFEDIEIDFSDLPAGTSGLIAVYFGWFCDDFDEEKNIAEGSYFVNFERTLAYYVGENGVGLASGHIELAKENLEKAETDYKEIQHTPFNMYCNSKPLYLKPIRQRTVLCL